MKKGDEHMQWYLGKVLQKVSEGRAGGRTVRRLSSVDDCDLYMAVIASHFWETAARAPPRLQGVKALQNKTLNPLPLEDATHFQVVESHLIRAETPETGCSYLKNDEYLQDKNGDNFRGEDAHCVVCDSECAYKMMP